MKRLALLTLIFVAPVSYAQDISSYLPDFIGAYTKSDSMRIYAGDELYELIDGGADLFREYGFDSVVVRRYSEKDDNLIDVELYRMKDSSSAYGIFSAVTYTTGNRIDDLPCEAYAGAGFLIFWKGKYYCTLTASRPSEREAMIRMANVVSERLQVSRKPSLVRKIEGTLSGKFDSLKTAYVTGSLGLYNVTKDSFWDGLKFIDGVFLSTPRAVSAIIRFGSEESCAEAYSTIAFRLRNESKWNPVHPSPDSESFERAGEKLKLVRFGSCLSISRSGDDAALERLSTEISRMMNGG